VTKKKKKKKRKRKSCVGHAPARHRKVRARCPRHALPQGLRDKVHHGPRRRVGIHLGVNVIIAEAAKKKKKRKNKKKSTNKEFTRSYDIKSKKQPSATQYSTSNIEHPTTTKQAVRKS
jgi:hypothetical protein